MKNVFLLFSTIFICGVIEEKIGKFNFYSASLFILVICYLTIFYFKKLWKSN